MKVQWQERKGTIIWITSIFLSVAQSDQIFENWHHFQWSLDSLLRSQRNFFFFLLTSIYLFSVKETRLEMTAWEELGQVFPCDKQHSYRDCIACFFRIKCKHNSNTRVLFKMLLGRFPWQFSSSDSVLSQQEARVGSLVRKLRSHTPGFISGLSVLSHWLILAVDWPRDCHTEWSKSELEKQISYNITCMWITQK